MIRIFPNIEEELIAGINTVFAEYNQDITNNVYISTFKAEANDYEETGPQYPEKQVIIRDDGGASLNTTDTVREYLVGFNIYSTSYQKLSQLARITEILIQKIHTEHIKKITISLSAVRLSQDRLSNNVNNSGAEYTKYLTAYVLTGSDEFTL